MRDFQDRVAEWVRTTFGEVFNETPQLQNPKLRAARFLEEATEAAQAAGLDVIDVDMIVAQVYARPVGFLHQEIGGCATTLAALAASAGINLEYCAVKEIERMETTEIREKVRARQASKVNPR